MDLGQLVLDITRAEIEALCLPGDIIAVEYLRPDETARAIRDGEGDPASHALCCLGGLDIVEASATGVIESSLHNYLRGNCRLTIRCAMPFPAIEQSEKATAFWSARVNDPYDWGMIFGSIPIILVSRLLGLFSKRLANDAVRYMPNLLASNSLSTCAELAARGIREFAPNALANYDVKNINPGILRTDDSLRTKRILDGAILVN